MDKNLWHDEIVLLSNGFSKINSLEDTMLMSYTLFAGLHNHNLEMFCNLYSNYEKIKYKDLVGTGKKEISFLNVSIVKAKSYSCEDDYTLEAMEIPEKSISKKNKLMAVYDNIEKTSNKSNCRHGS